MSRLKAGLLKMLAYAGFLVGVTSLCALIFGAEAGAFVFVVLLVLLALGSLAQIAARFLGKAGNSEIGRAILHGFIIKKINRRK
ncbi:MAG: hypothetical protein OXQ86_10860 [Gammaproteobacteria bacterium]|nr:hypothetical protein [Gammaproteobacteria bacterium]MDE0413218.1 hypothetical protein [Gammaproteobacteria bacterium]